MNNPNPTTKITPAISYQGQLYEFVTMLNRAESLDEVFGAALDAISAALKVERASVLICDNDGVMRFRAWRGLSEGYRKAVEGHSPWSPDEPNPEPVLIQDIASASLEDSLRRVVQQEGIAALGFIPLICKDRLLGKFMVYYRQPHVFREDELRLAQTIAYPLASAVERKRAEEALRASENRKTAILSGALDAIITMDHNGNIVDCNPAVEQIFGYPCEQLIGQSLADFLIPERLRQHHKEGLARYLTTGQGSVLNKRTEMPALHAAGHEFLVELSITHVHGIEPPLFTGTLRDISERKRAEAALRESEERFRSIFETAGVSIWEEDFSEVKAAIDALAAEGVRDFRRFFEQHPDFVENMIRMVKVRHINPTTIRLFGASDRTELLQSLQKIFLPETQKIFIEELVAIAEKKPGFEAETVVQTLRGERLNILFAITFPPMESFDRVLVTLTDITAQKRAEEALKKLNVELEQKVKERTSQLEQQSDRLRLLADQLTATEQAERKRIAALIHDHLQQILVAGKFHLHQAIKYVNQERYDRLLEKLLQSDEFLNEAMRAAKSLTAELRPPVLYEGGLIAAIQWLANKYREEHNLNTVLDVEEIPELDDNLKILIFELIRELLFNVIKHAHSNEVLVRMHYSRTGDLYLCVVDKGVGFDATLKEKAGLKGFGLFHIRERLRLLGAELTITSVPRRGTKVEVLLPLKKEVPEQINALQRFRGIEQKKHAEDKTITILMVDDHRIVREGIVNLLEEQQDFKVIAQAENGIEAVEKARMLVPDVIIMDINMPRLSGIEATRIIKSEMPNIRIIGLSVQDETETVRAMKMAGAETLLNKVEDPKELITIIRNNPHLSASHSL